MGAVKIDPKIRAIAWDLDGTIIDSFRIVVEIFNEIAESEKMPAFDEAFLAKNYHGSLRETIAAAFDDHHGDAEIDRLYNLFLDKQTRYYDSLDDHFLSDALSLVELAKKAGLQQVLVSNRNHTGHGNASPHYLVANSILKDAIGHVIAGDEVTHRKPDSRVLAKYLEDSGIASEELLVIGDQFVDGKLAMNLGTKAILVSRSSDGIHHLDQLGPGWEDHITIVTSLHDVDI